MYPLSRVRTRRETAAVGRLPHTQRALRDVSLCPCPSPGVRGRSRRPAARGVECAPEQAGALGAVRPPQRAAGTPLGARRHRRHRSHRARRHRRAGRLRAGHQRRPARHRPDHGAGARHPGAPPGGGPRRLHRAARDAAGAVPHRGAARRGRAAADLRPRPRHRRPLRRRVGRRDRGERQGDVVRPGEHPAGRGRPGERHRAAGAGRPAEPRHGAGQAARGTDPRPRRVRGPLPRAAPGGTAAGARPRGEVPPRQVARRPVRVAAARGAGRSGRRAAAAGPAGGARVGRPRGPGLAARRPRRWAGSWSCSTSPTTFCRQQQLLGLARTPPQVRFQTWFFTEFARQGSGRSARPWEAVATPV